MPRRGGQDSLEGSEPTSSENISLLHGLWPCTQAYTQVSSEATVTHGSPNPHFCPTSLSHL